MMHGGNVRLSVLEGHADPQNAAERVVQVLACGGEIGGWELTLAAKVSAVSTRVSEANASLRGRGWEIVCRREGRKAYYRLDSTGVV